MTRGTSLLLENLFSLDGFCFERMGIGRRLQGIDVKRQRIQLLIAITLLCGGIRQLAELFAKRYKAVITGQQVGTLIQCRLPHEVADAPMTYEP